MKLSQQNSWRRAFSLIEIMVAVTLLAVITVGLLTMFYHTQRAFRLGAGQVDTLEAGRTTMQMLSRELQEMYPSHITGAVNFAAAPASLAAGVSMDLPEGRFRTNMIQDISFLTHRGDQWIGVTYRVAHRNRGAGTLYRSMISTNPAIQNVAPPRPQWEIVAKLFGDITAGTPDVRDGNLAIESNPDFHRVADGVVHLRVRGAYDDQGRVFLESAPGIYIFTNGVPGYVDVELGILDPKALTQFNARSDAVAPFFLIDQAHRVHLFTQRVPIRAHRSQFDLFDTSTF